MELKTAIEILEYHQEWRLGKREDMIHEPKKLTEALDIVLSEVKKFRLGAVISRFNSDTFIDNVCLSYRHDFGLMAEQDKQILRFECKEWMRAISNNWEYFKNGL